MTTREAVVAEALTWEGTPYAHRARIKGIGVDCANLPAAVYEAVGLVPNINPEYSVQWYLHRDEEKFLEWVTPFSREIQPGMVKPGDLMVFKWGRTYSHSAIVIDYPEVIHAAAKGASVIRGHVDRDDVFINRAFKCFTLWDD